MGRISLKTLSIASGSIIFPDYCPGCGCDFLQTAEWFCPECWIGIPTPTPGEWALDTVLKNRTSVAFSYAAGGRELIHYMKYHGRPDIARFLGEKTVERVSRSLDFSSFRSIVPVPLHPVRIRERGFDQNLMISRSVSASTGIEINQNLIKRTRNTAPQARLSNEERRLNLTGAFIAEKSAQINRHDRLLLIDDVIHTGSTARGCIDALIEAGIRNVHVLAACG